MISSCDVEMILSKGIRRMITLKSAIIHSFKKLAHTDFVGEIVKKTVSLDINNPALSFLVDGINGLIGKDGNSVVYGQFSSDGREGPFPKSFKDYIGKFGAANEDAEFVGLTHLVMDQLVAQAAQQVLSTGGHILCALYESGASDFFIVASMKERGGIQLDANYVPNKIQEVDLSKVQQAARINIVSFNDVKARELLPAPADDDEELDSTYLCFLSKGRDSQASDYFINALGCAKGVASGRATKNAIDNVARFFRDKVELKGLGYKAKMAVVSYLQERLDNNKPAKLDEICHAATVHVPPELVESILGLKEYLNGEKNKVPDEFTVNAKSLKERTRIKVETPNWTLLFERGSLGKDPIAAIYYDEVRRKLTLSNLTPELVALIEKEFATRNV